MISGVSFDEAFCYDALSIIYVKQCKGSVIAQAAYRRMAHELMHAVGESLHLEIVCSSEFASLIQTNYTLFELIDKLNSRNEEVGDASAVNALNYERYLGKQKLQKKFFPEAPLAEQKIGYDKPQ